MFDIAYFCLCFGAFVNVWGELVFWLCVVFGIILPVLYVMCCWWLLGLCFCYLCLF